MFSFTRSEHNPILSPVREHPWEAAAAFNGSPIVDGRKTHLVYRAMSEPDLLQDTHIRTSVIGRATSKDGIHYEERSVLISPDTDFDKYGCEDPRVTKFEDTYYIFYTGLGGFPFNADNVKVAVALSTDLKTITEKHLVTPFNAKAMALFPERINGKIAALVTVNPDRKPSDVCYVEFENIEDMWSHTFWDIWWKDKKDTNKIGVRRYNEDHVELGAVPVKTEKGWLVVYSHIQKYGEPLQVFGIEAVLLDLKDPRKIIGRTKGPFLVPDAFYEHVGQVPHVVFPSGALIRGERLEVYYGAADSFCAVATVPLKVFLDSIIDGKASPVKRFKGNPIITPRPGMLWEQNGTLNPAAIDLGDKTHILYRAYSADNISTVGYATSSDGFTIDERLDKPIYKPRTELEIRGCEDARAMIIEDKVYMTYTAYDGILPRVAATSISTAHFLKRNWSKWTQPQIITPMNVDNKDAAIFSERIGPTSSGGTAGAEGKYMLLHRVHESICADFVSSLDFSKEKINKCIEIIAPRRGMWDGNKVGIACPPVKTDHGWLLLYHGVSWSKVYRVGAVLLDYNDPTIVKARTAMPILEPEMPYEKTGLIPNVVFPCGMVVRGGTAYIYYGGGDSVVGVATVKMAALMKMLEV